MSGVTGKTVGVETDIVEYLKAVADQFKLDIIVNSGKRTAEYQGEVMFDNWIGLSRGKVYKISTLPVADRNKLDGYYKTAKETPTATTKDKSDAKKKFVELAADKVGKKTKHYSGRAVDIKRTSIDTKAKKAIEMKMKYVPEPKNITIWHFESVSKIPKADKALKKKWSEIK